MYNFFSLGETTSSESIEPKPKDLPLTLRDALNVHVYDMDLDQLRSCISACLAPPGTVGGMEFYTVLNTFIIRSIRFVITHFLKNKLLQIYILKLYVLREFK